MTGFNFIDILIIAIIARGVYVGLKVGFLPGLFFLLGIIAANFFSIHYYSKFGESLGKWCGLPTSVGDFLVFIIFIGLIVAVFYVARSGWQILLKVEVSSFDRWGGLVCSLLSTVFMCGFLFLGIFILRNDFLMFQARNCFSYQIFGKTSIRTYEILFNGFVQRFFPEEHLNEKVFKVYARDVKVVPSEKEMSSEGKRGSE